MRTMLMLMPMRTMRSVKMVISDKHFGSNT